MMDEPNDIILRQLERNGIDSEIDTESFDNRKILTVRFYDELDFYADRCLFDGCSMEETRRLLEAFCSASYYMFFSWQVCCELSKLLAKDGQLIERKVEDFIFSDQANHFRGTSLHLSYFATDLKWEAWCLKCLDLCDEDFRDGLFLACYHLNTPDIYSSLVKHFSEWIEKDPDWGNGTGERLALKRFLKKWDETPEYTMHAHLNDIQSESAKPKST